MVSARVRGVDNLKKKLKRLPPKAKRYIARANEDNADEFAGLLERTIPRGDEAGGHLADTLRKSRGRTETAVRVSVGDEQHPYPLHLEAGHKTPGGGHVAGKPFWWPAKRRLKKKLASRATRALTKAVKEITS